MRHILLFTEFKTGATIAIGPFTCQDTAQEWAEKNQSKLNGEIAMIVPAFSTAAALAENKIEEA